MSSDEEEGSRTVYVLGAGCSRNYRGRSEIPCLKPPLDRDFFKMAGKVLQNSIVLLRDFECLIREMDELYHTGANTFFSLPEAWIEEEFSLESTLTFLDLRVGRESIFPGSAELAREQLIKLMRLTISEALKGPPCTLHRRLSRLIHENDAVISYNYDILADNALLLDGKINENSYLIPFRKVHVNSGWGNPSTSEPTVTLIKLHGSLNWLLCEECSSLLCYLGSKTPENSSYGPIDICPYCGSGKVRYILIPPILHKPYTQPGIKLLWDAARARLSRADRVVVIGYSMPLTDFQSELLFREALGNQKVSLDIVNPDRKVLNRFRSICRPLRPRWSQSGTYTFTHYASLNSFLNKEEESGAK